MRRRRGPPRWPPSRGRGPHARPATRASGRGAAGDPRARAREQNLHDSHRHRWGTRLSGRKARPTVGREVPCQRAGERPHTFRVPFPPTSHRKGTTTPHTRAPAYASSRVLPAASARRGGASQGGAARAARARRPPREWCKGARRRGAGPSGARARGLGYISLGPRRPPPSSLRTAGPRPVELCLLLAHFAVVAAPLLSRLPQRRGHSPPPPP